MGSGGMLLIYKTERVFKNILLFWALCALNKACAAPITNLHCNYQKLRKNIFAGMYNYFLNAKYIFIMHA